MKGYSTRERRTSRSSAAALVLGLALILGGIAVPSRGTTASESGGTLRLLNWSNYTSPDMLARFEAETGIKVELVEFGAMDDMVRMLREQPGHYDVVFPSHEWVPYLVENRMVQRFEPARLPGFQNVEPQWTRLAYDPGNDYTIPFEWGTTAFQLDRAQLPNAPASLATLFAPPEKARGKVGMLTDTSEVMGLVALHLGIGQCSSDAPTLARVEALLRAQKPSVGIYSSTDNIDAPAQGRTVLQMQWNGPAWFARKQRDTLEYVYPKEGVNGWTVALALAEAAPNQAAALRFMEWYLQPRNAAMQSAFSGYGPTVRGVEVHLPPDLQSQPEFIVPVDTTIHFLEACPRGVRAAQRAVLEKVFGG